MTPLGHFASLHQEESSPFLRCAWLRGFEDGLSTKVGWKRDSDCKFCGETLEPSEPQILVGGVTDATCREKYLQTTPFFCCCFSVIVILEPSKPCELEIQTRLLSMRWSEAKCLRRVMVAFSAWRAKTRVKAPKSGKYDPEITVLRVEIFLQ